MKLLDIALSSLVFLFLSINLCSQNTIKVPADVGTIQAALDDAVSGTTILVAPGIYYENLIWPKEVDEIKLIGEMGKELTIIDGSGLGPVISIDRKFSPINPVTQLTEIQGFTIQNGSEQENEWFNYGGGGLFIREASPFLKDLIVRENKLRGGPGNGGGAYMKSFKGKIVGCDFIRNTITTKGWVEGAGLYLEASGPVEIRDCSFSNNQAMTDSWCYGGGLYVSVAGSALGFPEVKIVNCTINDNSISSVDSWAYGAGAYLDDLRGLITTIDSCVIRNNHTSNNLFSIGGGIATGTSTTISNTKFLENSAKKGGGVSIANLFSTIGNEAIFSNCIFSGNSAFGMDGEGGAVYTANTAINLTLENCVIDHNKGSAIDCQFRTSGLSNGNITLNHCTVVYNEGPITLRSANFKSTNSIFWANGTENIKDNSGDSSNFDLKHCLVEGGFQGEAILRDDPLFIDENLLIPVSNSPCLNTGFFIDTINSDLLGTPRPLPVGSYPDLGAYEVDHHYANVSVRFYLDLDEDGMKSNEEPYTSLGSIRVQDEQDYFNFRSNGIFITVDQGPLRIAFNHDWNSDWKATSGPDYYFDVDSEDFSEKIEIGLSPEAAYSRMQAYIESDRFRCGEEVDFEMTIKNRGTIMEAGTIWLELDDRLSEYTFAIAPDYIENSNRVGWNFSDLLPSECFTIDYTVTAPLIETDEEVGEQYCFSANFSSQDRQTIFTYKTELRCSFDPNDKQVQPKRDDNLALHTVAQVYTIRFQNTGNDYARKVEVKDKIDGVLDLSTFQVLSTSHKEHLVVSFDDWNTVTFTFDNIYLPDSLTNEPASNGHVTYTIDPKEGLELNTIVTNTANIYFDFNPAIVTNTTVSILVDKFPIDEILDEQNFEVKIFPNPASDILNLSKVVDKIVVYDQHGRIVSKSFDSNRIDLNHLIGGIYLIELVKGEESYSSKFVIAK